MVKYRDEHKRVLEGSESTTTADIVGFVMEKYPHLPKINLVYEDNGEKFVLDDDDFNIMMEESKDVVVIISVVDKESKPELPSSERYGVYCVGLGIEVAAISPIAERTDYHRLLMGIAVGAFLVNLTGFTWVVTSTLVFEDNQFAPYLVAVGSLICVVITLYNFRGILGLKWVCEKAVNGGAAPSWIRFMDVLNLLRDGQTYVRMHFDALKAVQSGLETAAIGGYQIALNDHEKDEGLQCKVGRRLMHFRPQLERRIKERADRELLRGAAQIGICAETSTVDQCSLEALRKMLNSEFTQGQIKREKEERIGKCVRQITRSYKDMLKKKLEEVEAFNSSILQDKHKRNKTDGILKGTDQGSWDDFWYLSKSSDKHFCSNLNMFCNIKENFLISNLEN
ncbi:hypothetical protein Tco_0227720 [Tanacetum coccineum]